MQKFFYGVNTMLRIVSIGHIAHFIYKENILKDGWQVVTYFDSINWKLAEVAA